MKKKDRGYSRLSGGDLVELICRLPEELITRRRVLVDQRADMGLYAMFVTAGDCKGWNYDRAEWVSRARAYIGEQAEAMLPDPIEITSNIPSNGQVWRFANGRWALCGN